jgi:hypothetical protein
VAFNLTIFGGLLVLVLRVAPAYMEYLTVRDLLQRVAAEYDPNTQTSQDLRVRIGKLMNTNQVKAIAAEDIKISRERGQIVIDARYESRFPLIWIIDGVLVFDDLVVTIGPQK